MRRSLRATTSLALDPEAPISPALRSSLQALWSESFGSLRRSALASASSQSRSPRVSTSVSSSPLSSSAVIAMTRSHIMRTSSSLPQQMIDRGPHPLKNKTGTKTLIKSANGGRGYRSTSGKIETIESALPSNAVSIRSIDRGHRRRLRAGTSRQTVTNYS